MATKDKPESSEPFLSAGSAVNGGHGTSSSSNNHTYSNHPTTDYAGASRLSETATHEKPSRIDADNEQMKKRVTILEKRLMVMTAIVIVGIIIIITVVTTLYVNLNYNLVHHRHKPKVGEQVAAILEREELCLPCEDFRLGPSPEEEAELQKFTLKEETEGLKCCVDRPVELVDLLKLYVERRFRIEMARGTINFNKWPVDSSRSKPKPAAHLMMAHQDRTDDQIPGRQHMIGRWVHTEDLAFTFGATYRNGRIVIPEDGFYFVYSQISFVETFDLHTSRGHGSKHTTDAPSLSHYLYRYNIQYHNGGEEKLAQNSITKCWGQSKTFGEYVSNLGAVFFLRRSDEIFVKVSNLTMLVTDPKQSYFGMFKI